MSPAQQSKARKLAAKAPLVAAIDSARAVRDFVAGIEPDPARASEYDLQRAAIGEDLGVLKNIQSVASKIDAKAAMLPKYDAWVDGVIEASRAAEDAGKLIGQDDVLVETMIWAIDCADHARALPRIRVFFRHGMTLPQRFDRTPGCLVAEEFAETALKAMATDRAHIANHLELAEIAQLTEDHDMPDPARAKLYKALAQACERSTDAAEDSELTAAGGRKRGYLTAQHAYTRALAFDEKSGVKKALERVEGKIRKLVEAEG